MQLSGLAREPAADLALVSVGFEQRSRAVPTHLSAPALGIGMEFGDRHEDAYEDNRQAVADRGYEILVPESDPAAIVGEMDSWLERAASRRNLSERQPLRVTIDISSMTRTRIAAVIEASHTKLGDMPAVIDLLYAPASYRKCELDPPSFIHANPVTHHFAGWDPDASKELLACVGLGYEPYAAEGVVEYLTPDESIAIVPNGRDPHYRADVLDVNGEVLKKADMKLEYDVEDPYRLMLELERLVLAQIETRRIIFIPLGPKIFAAVCMLVAQRLHPMVSVWRFSAGARGKGQPAEAAGWLCGIRLTTQPQDTPAFDAEDTPQGRG